MPKCNKSVTSPVYFQMNIFMGENQTRVTKAYVSYTLLILL